MNYVLGGIRALFFGIVFLLSFIYRIIIGIISSLFLVLKIAFGSLRKLFVLILPGVYLYNYFIKGLNIFSFKAAIIYARMKYFYYKGEGKLTLIFGMAILIAVTFWILAKFTFKTICEISITFELWNYCAVEFNENCFKQIKMAYKQIKYGTGVNADYAMIKDFKFSPNYYGNIMKAEGKNEEYIKSYIRPTFFETVDDKGIDISAFGEDF